MGKVSVNVEVIITIRAWYDAPSHVRSCKFESGSFDQLVKSPIIVKVVWIHVVFGNEAIGD